MKNKWLHERPLWGPQLRQGSPWHVPESACCENHAGHIQGGQQNAAHLLKTQGMCLHGLQQALAQAG